MSQRWSNTGKRATSKLSIVIVTIGVITLIVGLITIPAITDLLSVSTNSLFANSHTYYRIVPTSQSSNLVTAPLIGIGLLLVGAGFALRRRHQRDL